MKSRYARACLLLLLFQLPTAVEAPHLKRIPALPQEPNILAGTWLIADLTVGPEGHVRSADVLEGEEPFRSRFPGNVSGWVFEPAHEGVSAPSRATAVLLFRGRDIFPGPDPDLSGLPRDGINRPPLPTALSDPGYPAASLGEGQVVFELHVSKAGNVDDVRLVQGVEGLTRFAEKTVRSWKFAPAVRNGTAAEGTVIAAISFLRPVTVRPPAD